MFSGCQVRWKLVENSNEQGSGLGSTNGMFERKSQKNTLKYIYKSPFVSIILLVTNVFLLFICVI